MVNVKNRHILSGLIFFEILSMKSSVCRLNVSKFTIDRPIAIGPPFTFFDLHLPTCNENKTIFSTNIQLGTLALLCSVFSNWFCMVLVLL